MEVIVESSDWNPWIGSLIGSILVGLSGVIPLIIIPDSTKFKDNSSSASKNHIPLEQSASFRLLLSFAVGGLLGDVFLHLLPEAWHLIHVGGGDLFQGQIQLGAMLLAGLFSFALLERLLTSTADIDGQLKSKEEEVDSDTQNNNCNISPNNKKKKQLKRSASPDKVPLKSSWWPVANPLNGMSSRQVTGYLNLLANSIDNFTHGLAVAGSFLVSTRVGILTTAAILLHEIPHEVADFAILLRAGFGRWEAAKAQLGTATIGIAGALTALAFNGSDHLAEGRITSWILPFTAGGFLHIALVTVLPELLQEADAKQSAMQVLFVLIGIAATAGVSLIVE